MIVEEAQKHLSGTSVEFREGDTDPRNYRVAFGKIADRLGFRVDHTVQTYVPALVAAVQAGVFSAAAGHYGNYEVRHLT
jgi:hypothetical protein